jgi:hypothetical protein
MYAPHRHPGAGRGPVANTDHRGHWIPACAGMTSKGEEQSKAVLSRSPSCFSEPETAIVESINHHRPSKLVSFTDGTNHLRDSRNHGVGIVQLDEMPRVCDHAQLTTSRSARQLSVTVPPGLA